MLLCVNLHGGFLGGFLLLGAYLAGNVFELFTGPATERDATTKRVGHLLALAGAALIACLCNPSGYHILLFPFKLVGNRYLMDHVSEFLSPNFHEFLPFKYLLLLLIALVAASRKTVRATELFLVLMFTSMGLYSTRYIPLFALVTAPVLTRHWCWNTETAAPQADFFSRCAATLAQTDARSAGFCWPAAALIAVALAVGTGNLKHSFDAKVKAVAATEFLMRENIRGNMFNDDEFGDYLIYRAFPHYRVFFDGRSDMYGAGKLREYYEITNFEPGWEQVLDRYGISWIFYGTSSSLSRFLLKDANWVLVYSDPVASIFVKDRPQYRQLIERNRLGQLAPSPPVGGAP